MSALLSVEDVSVRFGGVLAVDRARFALSDGQLLGIIGPNGAGKTTLMRAIVGVVQPDTGSLYFNGEDITHLSTVERIRRGLALGQQIVRPLRTLSVLDNVALAAGHGRLISPWRALFSRDREPERRSARTMLKRVGLEDVADQLPDTLPLGYLKRLEVARALALNPRLLLLDEPLAGLNAHEATGMADLIASLPRPGLSVVLIEHNLGEVLRICPTLYVQDNGHPLAYGPSQDVMAREDVRAAYIGTSPDATARGNH